MKKKMTYIILSLLFALFLCGCQGQTAETRSDISENNVTQGESIVPSTDRVQSIRDLFTFARDYMELVGELLAQNINNNS